VPGRIRSGIYTGWQRPVDFEARFKSSTETIDLDKGLATVYKIHGNNCPSDRRGFVSLTATILCFVMSCTSQDEISLRCPWPQAPDLRSQDQPCDNRVWVPMGITHPPNVLEMGYG
jgi:hypothetical protein